jgi:hypothetical protein
VVSDKSKFVTSEIGRKMVHTPNGGLHFEKKWGVIAFMLLQLAAGVCDDAVLAIRVDLDKDGPKAPRLFVIA